MKISCEKNFNNEMRKTRLDKKNNEKQEFPDPDKNLLWKLQLKRREAFENMNDDVDEIVSQCLKTKRHLQAVEDSNRNLKKELRSLRSKYESLLEKNKHDTGIIMRLKDSESLLKKAIKNQVKADASLQDSHLKSKEKAIERNLLQGDREKLLFKSQMITSKLRKINLKHQKYYKQILEEDKLHKENEERLTHEVQQLECIFVKNDSILERWLKNNAERDIEIRALQDDIKNGLKDGLQREMDETKRSENNESLKEDDNINGGASVEKAEKVNVEIKVSKEQNNVTHSEREIAFQKEFLSKKILFEVAEKEKEHWMDFYMVLNKRMQDLNIEIINVREWLLDKEAEKRELKKRIAEMEKLVAQKRRARPVPPRACTTEMEIWINVQRQTNDALRKVVSSSLSVKLDDTLMYSEFASKIRNIFLDALREHLLLDSQMEALTAPETQATDEK